MQLAVAAAGRGEGENAVGALPERLLREQEIILRRQTPVSSVEPLLTVRACTGGSTGASARETLTGTVSVLPVPQ